MISKPRPALERLVEAISAVALGGAAAFAVAQGAGWSVAGTVGIVVAGAALMLLSRIDRADDELGERFEVVDFPSEDVLLLDDPLPALDPHSRVVQLFAGEPRGAGADRGAIVGPGDMMARIEDFLGSARGAGATAAPAARAASDEANAALHAALADIRRSLRHG